MDGGLEYTVHGLLVLLFLLYVSQRNIIINSCISRKLKDVFIAILKFANLRLLLIITHIIDFVGSWNAVFIRFYNITFTL